MSEFPTSGSHGSSSSGTVQRAKGAAADTAHMAQEQARNVGGEMKDQAGKTVDRLRGRVREEADGQSRRAAQSIRQWADELTSMADNGKQESPVHGVIQHVAGTGHKAADYLENHGFGGIASDAQEFARKRPAVFLVGALAAGFLAARLAKAGTQAVKDDSSGWSESSSGSQHDQQGGQKSSGSQYGQSVSSSSGTSSAHTGTQSPSEGSHPGYTPPTYPADPVTGPVSPGERYTPPTHVAGYPTDPRGGESR